MTSPISRFVLPLAAALWTVLAATASSQPQVTKRALMESVNALPAAVLAVPHTVVRTTSATQAEAEALFAASDAAVYLPDKGVILSLVSGDVASPWSAAFERADAHFKGGPTLKAGTTSLVARTQSLGESTLAEFAAHIETTIAEARLEPGANYLVKFPSVKERPVAEGRFQAKVNSLPVKALDTNYYLLQDFEGDVWSYWSRGDNTGGQYRWAVTNCTAHSGYYSANPVRGGTQGAYLGCSANYPPSVETWMYSQLCQTIPADWYAWGSVYITGTIGTGADDYLAFYASDQSGQHLYGYSFYGTWQGWFKIAANLRQWYVLGDLGQYACNTFYIDFSSSANTPAGAGPYVDDIEFDVGPTATTTGQSQAFANPAVGQAPLTVSFTGVTDLTSGTFHWDFGDGSTSTAMAPVHIYTTPGTYVAEFRAAYGGVVGFADITVTVQPAPACSYGLSATSQSFAAGGGTGTVNVITGATCSWTASSNASSWLHVTRGASGTGNGTVGFAVDANTGSSRSASLTIAGQTFTVTQAALTCSYSLTPTSVNFLATGGTGIFTVTSPTGCQWGAASQAAWISITAGSSGTGSGTISYSVQANTGNARTGTITVAGQTLTINQSAGGSAYTYSYWVPVASHANGLNQSRWRSDLGLLNTGSVTANVQLKFFGGNSVSTTTYVAPQAQSILVDIVGQMNASGSGPIEVLSDQPLKVTARSYNQVASDASCYGNGTQGQNYPVVATSDGLGAGQVAYLAGLTENPSYRCNIGLANTGTAGATVLVELFDGAGSNLASYTVPLAAGQWVQATQPFMNVGRQTAMDRGYAKITVQSGSGVFAVASVIDNITTDPTTVVMQR